MKIVCSKNDLLTGVNIVMKAVPSKTSMPILECILINAEDGEIKLTVNDMELGIETKVNGNIEEAGMIAIEAKLFAEIVRKLPNDDITIDVSDDLKVKITCQKAKFDLIGLDGNTFSFLPDISKNESIYISQFSLREIINQTLFSVADNDKTKILTGELIEVNGSNLRVASLDGFRISIRNITLKEEFGNVKVIVPGKTLSEISKILTGGLEDMVNISFTENHILFEFDNTVVVSRLIEGEFFKIDKMISNDYETKVKVNRNELMSAIDRATLLAKEGNIKPIILNINDDAMNIKMNSFIGSMDEDVDVDKEGGNLVIGFNPKFIIEALRAIDDEEVDIYFVNSKSPCFIKNEELSYIYLIVPVNINTNVN